MLNKRNNILTSICISIIGLSLPTTSSSAVNKNSCQNVFILKSSITFQRIEKVESEIIQLIKTIDSETDIIKRSSLYQKLLAVWQEYRENLSANSNDLINQKIRQIRIKELQSNSLSKTKQIIPEDQRSLSIEVRNSVTGESSNYDLKVGDQIYYYKIRDENAWTTIPDEDYLPSKIDFSKGRIIDFNQYHVIIENSETKEQTLIHQFNIIPNKVNELIQLTYLIRNNKHMLSGHLDTYSNEVDFGRFMTMSIYGTDMRAFDQIYNSISFQVLPKDQSYFDFKNQNLKTLNVSKLRSLTEVLLNENKLIAVEDFIDYIDFFINLRKSNTTRNIKSSKNYTFNFNRPPFIQKNKKTNQIFSAKLTDLLFQTKKDMNSLDIFDAALYALMSKALLFRSPGQSNILVKSIEQRFDDFIKPYYQEILKSEFGRAYIYQLQTSIRNMRSGLLPTEMSMEQVINEIKLKQRELK